PGDGEADVASAVDSEMLTERLGELDDLCHVARAPARLVAIVAQPLRLARRALCIDVRQSDLGAGLGNALGIGEPDPARRAGDQRRAAANVELVQGLRAFHRRPFALPRNCGAGSLVRAEIAETAEV